MNLKNSLQIFVLLFKFNFSSLKLIWPLKIVTAKVHSTTNIRISFVFYIFSMNFILKTMTCQQKIAKKTNRTFNGSSFHFKFKKNRWNSRRIPQIDLIHFFSHFLFFFRSLFNLSPLRFYLKVIYAAINQEEVRKPKKKTINVRSARKRNRNAFVSLKSLINWKLSANKESIKAIFNSNTLPRTTQSERKENDEIMKDENDIAKKMKRDDEVNQFLSIFTFGRAWMCTRMP